MTHDVAPESPCERFAALYAGGRPPWDIGRPQPAFVSAVDEIRRGGAGRPARVLDCGCGTGDLAIFLAGLGCAVTGVDFLDAPLATARARAAAAGVAVNFLRMDACDVAEIPERFDAVTDCALFHSLEITARLSYVAALARLLEPGARVFLLCFSELEPGTHGPHRVSEAEVRAAFASGWAVESVVPARFEVVPGVPGAEFTPGGAQARFFVIRRV